MDRRAFIGNLALGALAVLRVTSAQPAGKVYRIGILSLRMTSDLVGPQPRSPATNALLRGLRELGYVYGEHFVTEPRGGEGKPERFPRLAVELVRLQMDVILAAGPALPALKQATSTIPVIMTATLDPVRQGFVESLGHPGGNFTGFSLQSVETVGKRLELLKELVPSGAPVAVLWDQSSILNWQAAKAAARERRWKLPKGPSGRRLAGGPALSSCSGPGSSSRTPGGSRNWPPRAGSRPCMSSGSMSRPAG